MPKERSCNMCPKTFASSQALYYHKQRHSGVKYNCPQCNKSFSTDSSLKMHSLIHAGEKPHKCTECDKSFRQKGTPSFTVEKRYTHATSVTFHATKLPPSKRILRSTMVTEYTIALNVNTKQRNQGTWQITRKRTLVKSHRDAQYASILASQLVH